MAAGLSIKTEKIDEFQQKFESFVVQKTEPDDFIPKLLIDCELNFNKISDRLIDELDTMQPFGFQNREPLFYAKNISVASSSIVGKNHRKLLLKQNNEVNGKTINAIHFNVDTTKPLPTFFEKMAFKLRWNHWKNSKTAQIVVEET